MVSSRIPGSRPSGQMHSGAEHPPGLSDPRAHIFSTLEQPGRGGSIDTRRRGQGGERPVGGEESHRLEGHRTLHTEGLS